MKEVNNQNLWYQNLELGSQGNTNIPIWIVIGFQQRDRQDSQNLYNDSFCRLPVISAQCNIGTEKYQDASILLNYDHDDYSYGYAQIKEVFRVLTKDDILQPYIADDDFKSFNAGVVELGYNIYAFDIRCQQNFTASQPVKVEFIVYGVVPNDINAYGLVLTNKFFSMSSDGQWSFDLIWV